MTRSMGTYKRYEPLQRRSVPPAAFGVKITLPRCLRGTPTKRAIGSVTSTPRNDGQIADFGRQPTETRSSRWSADCSLRSSEIHSTP